MKNEQRRPVSGRIKILPEQVAHKIAAGEVIERPASVVRELIDNSIDAESSSVDLYVVDGGVREIRVVDNGAGMAEEDLKLCFLAHATSKIAATEDLLRISTLGFRGEALSSISASADVEITSRLRDGKDEAVKVKISGGKLVYFGPEKGAEGTTVIVRNLFHSIPARKQFLKQPAAEGRMCRQVFIEKALPFPEVRFRYFSGKNRPFVLPPSTLKERVSAAYGNLLSNASTIEKREVVDETLAVTFILSYPETFRHDRRYIHIYVNNRKIDEYGFLQAVVHGYGDFLPGGRFPYAFVFIEIEPSFVDFNIHPAKKEARFRNKAKVHHAVTEGVRAALYHALSSGGPGPEAGLDRGNRKPSPAGHEEKTAGPAGGPSRGADTGWLSSIPRNAEIAAEHPRMEIYSKDSGIVYLGRLFSMFLLASAGDSFFIIDQHAAHERILFNKFSASPPPAQKLLVPLYFEVDEDEHELLLQSSDRFSDFGIELEETGKCRWKLSAFPFPGGKSKIDAVGFIREHITCTKEIKKEFFARLACGAAVKEGELLEASDALELIRNTLALPEPRCPHGRPVWHRLAKDELFRLVGRQV